MWKRADRVVVCVQSPMELCLGYTVTVQICCTMYYVMQIINMKRKLALILICKTQKNDYCWEICLNNIIFYNTTKQHRTFVWLPWLFCCLRTVAWRTYVCFYSFSNIFLPKNKNNSFSNDSMSPTTYKFVFLHSIFAFKKTKFFVISSSPIWQLLFHACPTR